MVCLVFISSTCRLALHLRIVDIIRYWNGWWSLFMWGGLMGIRAAMLLWMLVIGSGNAALTDHGLLILVTFYRFFQMPSTSLSTSSLLWVVWDICLGASANLCQLFFTNILHLWVHRIPWREIETELSILIPQHNNRTTDDQECRPSRHSWPERWSPCLHYRLDIGNFQWDHILNMK